MGKAKELIQRLTRTRREGPDEQSSLPDQHDRFGTPQMESLLQQLSTSGWKLSARDERAVSAYEQSCKEHSVTPNRWDAGDFIREFRGLDEEQQQDQVNAQRGWDRDTGIDR